MGKRVWNKVLPEIDPRSVKLRSNKVNRPNYRSGTLWLVFSTFITGLLLKIEHILSFIGKSSTIVMTLSDSTAVTKLGYLSTSRKPPKMG